MITRLLPHHHQQSLSFIVSFLLLVVVLIAFSSSSSKEQFTALALDITTCGDHSDFDLSQNLVIRTFNTPCDHLVIRDSIFTSSSAIQIQTQSNIAKITFSNITCMKTSPGACIHFPAAVSNIQQLNIHNIELKVPFTTLQNGYNYFYAIRFVSSLSGNPLTKETNVFNTSNIVIRNANVSVNTGHVDLLGLLSQDGFSDFDQIIATNYTISDCVLATSSGKGSVFFFAVTTSIAGTNTSTSLIRMSSMEQQRISMTCSASASIRGVYLSALSSFYNRIVLEDFCHPFLECGA